jgi:hypothetical protein
MTFGPRSSRCLLGCVTLLMLAAIEGDLPAREGAAAKKSTPAAPVARTKALDHAWKRKMFAILDDPFDVAERRTFVLSLAEPVERKVADLPDGEIWRKRWRLNELRQELSKAKPDLASLTATLRAVSTGGPVGIEPERRMLVFHFGSWLGRAKETPQLKAKLRRDIDLISTIANQSLRAGSLKPHDEDSIRAAFRELAAQQRFNIPLAEYRAARSSFNYRTRMSDDYIEAESRREFTIPVDVPTNAGGIAMRVRGEATAVATVEVVPNETQGELRVDVASVGRFGVSGSRKRMTFSATSTQRLKATQPMYLGPLNIDTPGSTVRDRSCTALNWLQVCSRLPCVGRLVARIAEPIASRKIAEQDPVIARKVEDQVRERVAEEGFDIAHRINGRFGAVGSEIFPNDGDKPRLTIRSTSDDITWSALYADADELGALAPPADDAAEYDVRHWVHESAIENWGTRLDGKPLDEATFHSLLRENVKFFSEEFDKLPAMRSPAVLLFAAGEPLSVKLRDGAIAITLRLQGYALGSDVNFEAPRTVTLRYRPVVDRRGMRLVRDQEDYLKDSAWKKVLDHFLPAELTPVARFQNASLKSRLELRRLTIADGWLSTGATRVAVAPAADNVAKAAP